MKKVMMLFMLVLFGGSLFFAGWGVSMHQQVDVEEAEFHALQADYFTLAKGERDGAETGSELNAQLVELQQTPSELLRLKLVGVGRILTGIYILLFGILMALMMMPMKLGMVLKKK